MQRGDGQRMLNRHNAFKLRFSSDQTRVQKRVSRMTCPTRRSALMLLNKGVGSQMSLASLALASFSNRSRLPRGLQDDAPVGAMESARFAKHERNN